MRRYRLSGFVIESNVPLPELPSASGDPSYIFELLRKGPRRVPRQPLWYHHWQEAHGKRWLSFARTADRYLLRFPSLAEFEVPRGISRGASRGALRHAVHIEARGGTMVPRDTLRHLLLDQIWPLVLSGSGRLVVHASAIVLPDGHAIGFAGPAGAGKSTLAASLVAAGCHLVSDDCLLLENAGRSWRAVPSYPGLRLWPDVLATVLPRDGTVADVAHYTSKKRYADRALPFARTPAPLRALYILHPSKASGKAALTEVTGAAALMDLVPYTYLLDHEDRTQLGRSFAQLAALTRRVRVLRLDVPRTIRRLGEVTELLTRRS